MALPHIPPAHFPPAPIPEAGGTPPGDGAGLLLAGAPGQGAHFGPNHEFLPSSDEGVDRHFFNSLNRVRLLGDRANALIAQSYNFRRRLMDKIQRMRRLVFFMRAVVTKIQTAVAEDPDAGPAAAAACRAEIADALAAERRGVIQALDPLSDDLLRTLVELLEHPGLDVDQILAALQDAIAAWNTEVHRLVAMLPPDQQNAPPAPAAPPGDAAMAGEWAHAGGLQPAGENAGAPLGPQAPDIRGDDELHGNIGAVEVATRAPYPYAPDPAAADANYAYHQAGAPAGPVQHGGWTPTGVRKRKSHRKRHGKKGKKHKTKHKKKKRHKTKHRRRHRRRRRRTKHRR